MPVKTIIERLLGKKRAALAQPGRRMQAFGAFGEPCPTPNFEAGATGRRLGFFRPAAVHVNAAMELAGPTVLARARWLARNNGYAKNALEAWATSTVGAGIKPSSLIEDEETLEAVQDAWNEWVDEADVEGVADFYSVMHRVSREVFLAGECFVRFRPALPQNGLSVPLQLQVLPSEQLPWNGHYVEASNGFYDVVPEGFENAGGDIRMGIEFDREVRDRRVAYWFYRSNPTDTTTPFRDLLYNEELVRIPADEIMHVYDPVEAGQIRGTSGMAAAIVKLFQLDAFDDSELERQRQQSRYATFITIPPESDELGNILNGRPDDSDPTNWSPGQTVELHGGEDVKFAQPPAVGGTYEPFQYRTLLQVCAALGIPYAELTNDLQRTTYASSRAGLVSFRARIEAFQHNVLSFQMLRPVWQRWLDYAVLGGAVPISAAQYRADLAYWRAMKAITPKVQWVDPLKDIQATILQLKACLISPQDAIESLGYDLKETYERIAEAKDLESELGITPEYGTTSGGVGGGVSPGRAAGTPPVIPSEVEPDEGSAAA
jgi:lambda family phage portal protein